MGQAQSKSRAEREAERPAHFTARNVVFKERTEKTRAMIRVETEEGRYVFVYLPLPVENSLRGQMYRGDR